MERTDNYLLLLIGVLLVVLISIEMIPPSLPGVPAGGPQAPAYRPIRFGSASLATVLVIPTSTYVTLTVS